MRVFSGGLVVCLALCAGLAVAQERQVVTAQDFSQIFSDVAERSMPSVVTILASRMVQADSSGEAQDESSDLLDQFGDNWLQHFFHKPAGPERPADVYQRALGSGVIVRADGYILTNHHVIDKADNVRVRLYDQREIDAQIVGTDPKSDIAVVKIDAQGLTPAKIGSSDALRIGEWILCVGSPLSENLDHTLTAGIVSAKGRSNVGLADYESYIQTDAAINPGNSGGPMLNLKGEVVGINTAIASQTGGYQGVSFAVPSNMALDILEQLIANGKVIRGWMGIVIQDVDEVLAEALRIPMGKGVLVGDVVEGGPGAKAGIRVGDVLLSLNGQPVLDVAETRNRIAAFKPGMKVAAEISRLGKSMDFQVSIDELAEEVPEVPEEPQVNQFKALGLSVMAFSDALAERYNLPADASKGLIVANVQENSVGWDAGLREGDLLRSANRQNLHTAADLARILDKTTAGATVLLFVERTEGTLFIAFRKPS